MSLRLLCDDWRRFDRRFEVCLRIEERADAGGLPAVRKALLMGLMV